MSLLRRIRLTAGALLYDWPRFEATLHGLGPYRGLSHPWVAMRNRNEHLTLDERGARCDWIYGSDLHIANVLPFAGARLQKAALRDWPVEQRDAPASSEAPRVSFVIGHRGGERLPHLLLTLRSIAGQREVPVECIVVEQSESPEVRLALPEWVRYVHTTSAPGADYNRSQAFNEGARVATGEVLVLHDNDMVCPALYAAEALDRVREGHAFQQLKRFVFYLSERDTARVFTSGSLPGAHPSSVVQNVHGGSMVAAREAFFAIGGFDESFLGWGGEDNEFWDRAQSTGRVYDFGYLPFTHLWHMPQKGKLAGNEAPAVRRWQALKEIPAGERIRRLVEADAILRRRGDSDSPPRRGDPADAS